MLIGRATRRGSPHGIASCSSTNIDGFQITALSLGRRLMIIPHVEVPLGVAGYDIVIIKSYTFISSMFHSICYFCASQSKLIISVLFASKLFDFACLLKYRLLIFFWFSRFHRRSLRPVAARLFTACTAAVRLPPCMYARQGALPIASTSRRFSSGHCRKNSGDSNVCCRQQYNHARSRRFVASA